MCTFLLQNGALWDICQMHCGICGIGLLKHLSFCDHHYCCGKRWPLGYLQTQWCIGYCMFTGPVCEQLTHCPLGDGSGNFKFTNFQTHIKDRYIEHCLRNYPQVNATGPVWWLVNIVLVNSNKLLPIPMLTQIYVGIWPPQGRTELTEHSIWWFFGQISSTLFSRAFKAGLRNRCSKVTI